MYCMISTVNDNEDGIDVTMMYSMVYNIELNRQYNVMSHCDKFCVTVDEIMHVLMMTVEIYFTQTIQLLNKNFEVN